MKPYQIVKRGNRYRIQVQGKWRKYQAKSWTGMVIEEVDRRQLGEELRDWLEREAYRTGKWEPIEEERKG